MLRRRVLAAAAPPVLLAACTAPQPPTTSPTLPTVELSYWKSLSGPRHDAQVALTERFNDSQREVRVSLEHAGEYNALSEKLRIALASGAPPDVVMLGTNADLPAFAHINALEPLDALVTADKSFRLDDFSPGFIRDSRFGDTLVQLPFARSVPLLVANVDQLRAAGLPETPPATWASLLERGHALMRAHAPQSAEGKPYAAFGSGTGWWEFQSLLWSHGGAFSDERRRILIDTPASIGAAQLLADLVHRHRIAAATKRMLPDFQSGALSLLVTSSANLTQLADGASFALGVAPIPSLDERISAQVPGGGAGLSLIRGVRGRRQQAGWAFLRHMTSAESSSYFARSTGYAPVRPDALRDPQLAAFYASLPGARLALEQRERVRPADAILATPLANRHIEQALDRILFANENVPTTCTTLATTLQRLVNTA